MTTEIDSESVCTEPAEVAPSTIERLEARIDSLERALDSHAATTPDTNKLNLLVFENYRDRLLASLVVANGAAACGMDVSMFFTFWSTAALRKGSWHLGKKSWVERAFAMMLPHSAQRTKLSQMDMCGLGRKLMAQEMKKKRIANVDELLQTAADLGVRIRVCETSMNLMGVSREELIDYPHMEFCGVAQFVEDAASANTTLFI